MTSKVWNTSIKSLQQTRTHIEKFALFHDLSDTEIDFLVPFIERQIVAPKKTLIEQGQSGNGLFLLMEGTVKVFLETISNDYGETSEIIVAICGPGDTIGEIDVADGIGHTASVVTRERSIFLWISTVNFWYCYDRIPRLGRNLSRVLAGRLRHLTTACDMPSTMHLPQRVAFHLLRLSRNHGIHQPNGTLLIPYYLSQDEWARLVGSSRGGINRVLCQFKAQEYIDIKRGCHVSILNIQALKKCCGDFDLSI